MTYAVLVRRSESFQEKIKKKLKGRNKKIECLVCLFLFSRNFVETLWDGEEKKILNL